MKNVTTMQAPGEVLARVYCPICTHTVEAQAVTVVKRLKVKPGQRCSRCSSQLDAGVVLYLPQAA